MAENELLKQHLADVLRTAFESNETLFREMKEAGKMSEAVERVFWKEIKEVVEKEKDQTIENMLKDKVALGAISKWTGASVERIVAVATKLGMSSLSL